MAGPRFGTAGGPRLGQDFGPGGGYAGPQEQYKYRADGTRQLSYRVRMNTGAIYDRVRRTLGTELERVLVDGEKYWQDVEWVEARHPEMTGAERDAARFFLDATRKKGTLLALMEIDPAAMAGETNPEGRRVEDYVDFEERGTIYREGHWPMHNTQRVMHRSLQKRLAAHR